MFTKIGPLTAADSSLNTARGERSGAVVVSDAHGRFQEAAIRGNLFSGGMTLTSIANATFTTGTLGATCTPIIGLWNTASATGGKYLAVLQVRVQTIVTAATATGPGAYVWATATSQTAITTGISPLNRLNLGTSGSIAKVFANTALTGLSGNLTVQEAAGIAAGPAANFSEVGTAAGFVPSPSAVIVEPVDGAFLVPPGGVLALLGTTTPVAISAASSILWEEISA